MEASAEGAGYSGLRVSLSPEERKAILHEHDSGDEALDAASSSSAAAALDAPQAACKHDFICNESVVIL